jgi:hypothetical protein
MQALPLKFEDTTFRYEQLERDGPIAIYRQTHKVGGGERFEVVRIRIREAHTWPNGTTTPEHEAYPGSSTWGKDGFTYYTLQAARIKAAGWTPNAH